jgi:hypothetical protein
MATMPSRGDTAPAALRSILPQVSRLWLFLDRFESVPTYAEDDRIRILRSQDWGDLRANGKLLGVTCDDEPCTFFSLDDDVEYPADYCTTLESQLDRYAGLAVVGVHAAVLETPVTSYVRSMSVMHRRAAVTRSREVDLLGTDSVAFRTEALSFDVRDWEHVNVVDLSFAFEARTRSFPLVSIPRKKGWLHPLDERQHDSIWMGVRRDDTLQTQLAQELMALPRPALPRRGSVLSLLRTLAR